MIDFFFFLAFGSKMAGEKSDTFEIVLHTLFIMPDYLPIGKKYMSLKNRTNTLSKKGSNGSSITPNINFFFRKRL